MSTLPDGLMIGPGSQPEEEDGTLSYMPMPSGMSVFSAPHLPEPEDAAGMELAMGVLQNVLGLLSSRNVDLARGLIDITSLDDANRTFIDQLLGEGEVSPVGGATHQAQESVLAGVWRIRITDKEGRRLSDLIEVGSFPQTLLDVAFLNAQDAVDIPETFGANVFNTPALLPEINEHVAQSGAGTATHIINLSLLPHTPEDLSALSGLLGKGALTILSRGYGNCRVTSSATRNCWWVQYYNSQDTLILNSIEITSLPEVTCAAVEDLNDSAERLKEILEVYQ